MKSKSFSLNIFTQTNNISILWNMRMSQVDGLLLWFFYFFFIFFYAFGALSICYFERGRILMTCQRCKMNISFLSIAWASIVFLCFLIVSQSSGKSSVLESIVGKDFLPRGSGNIYGIHTFGIFVYSDFSCWLFEK